MELPTQYLIPAAVAAFLVWRWRSFRRVRRELPRLLAEGAQVVDVRAPGEYAAGHFEPSRNIPVGELAARAKELDQSRPVIVCCASGTRSAAAVGILKAAGFARVVNAGPWTNVVR